jgi:hypothetical protein
MASKSIIEVIQKMVQEGQPKEKIVTTLKELGVDEAQANKLLLIAESDTFSLLKKELGGLVREEFVSQKGSFEDLIHKSLESIEEEESKKIQAVAKQELYETEQDFYKKVSSFQDSVTKTVMGTEKTVSLVKAALDSINTRLSEQELDIEQLKVHKFRRGSMLVSYTMLGFGAVILVISFLMIFLNFSKLDFAQILIICVLILASVTLMFASIIS